MLRAVIRNVRGREILDSRGNPAVEAQVELADGTNASAIAPSGASTGEHEALELRDMDENRFGGKGVQKAVGNISDTIAPALSGRLCCDQRGLDETLIKLDGTDEKRILGANATLSVSLACAAAAAGAFHLPLYRYLGGIYASRMPVPMYNILNGGAHTSSNVEIQEFMIIPAGTESFREGLRKTAEVYHMLGKILKNKGLSVSVGDEGGYAPDLSRDEKAIEYILMAVREAGYEPGKDFVLALDAAASEWKGSEGENGEFSYIQPKCRRTFSTEELISYWIDLCDKYPIVSIEDPLDENDWGGWRMLTEELGNRIQLVGDDLFVTSTDRIRRGISENCGNAVLIKPNQIGTLWETFEAIRMAQINGYRTIISHRSGETEDTFIADLAVAVGAGQIKTGAPCRGERTAKYNRLIRIEEELRGNVL